MPKKFANTVTLKFLQSHALFGGIEDEELIKFLTFMKQEEYPKGKKIVIEGAQQWIKEGKLIKSVTV